MKKIFTVIIAAVMAAAAWATDTNYSPTAEYNVRPKVDGTGWTKTVDEGNASNKKTFEITASACFYAIQQYKVADIKNATKVTLALTNEGSSGSDALAVWAFKGTFAADMSASDFNTAFNNTTGVAAGTSGTHSTKYLLKDIANSKNPNSTFEITGTPLDTLKKLAGTDGSFTLLITNKTADLDGAAKTSRKYQSSNSANANPPVLTVTTPSYVVTNLTTGAGFTDLATAVSAASENDELQLNENVTVSGSRIENTVALTIQGKEGNEIIYRATNLDNMIFLPRAALTLKNLVIDGQNIKRKKTVIEASDASCVLTMENVTIQKFDRSDTDQKQGFVLVKQKTTIKNCTFKDNKVASGYGDVFVGTSDKLTLQGNNVIPDGIYVEKGLYFTDNEASHTSPITVIADPARTALSSNYAFIKGTTDTYKYSLSNASWDIAGNETQSWIYVTKAASTTKSSDKTMEAGKGYKLSTVTIK